MKFSEIFDLNKELCYSPLDNLTSENEKRINNRLKEQIILFN
jgi:hypothetical protein